MSIHPGWVTRGKTIRQLIHELQSFEDQDLEVQISVDGGTTQRCISLVGKSNGVALLKNCEDDAPADADSIGYSKRSPTDRERILAQAVYEIRLLLSGYLGSQNVASMDVRQAAHLAYALHNVALGAFNGEEGDLSKALGAIEGVDKMLGSEFSKTFAGSGLGV